MTFALRSLHGAALFDSGRQTWGLQEMQQARTDLGAVFLTGEQAAALAVLEHRAALTLNLRAAVGPLLNGSVPAVLPHTVVEALLVEATAGVRSGELQAARTALRAALSLAKPL